MGSAGSVRRGMREEVVKIREEELNREEELEKKKGDEWARQEAVVGQLRSEKHELAEELRATRASLREQSEGWRREKSKATALMFSELPLSMISGGVSSDMTDGPADASLSKKFPLVTLAQSNVAGFSSLTSSLHPQEVVQVIDQLHALIDEVFVDEHIFLMERTSDGCIAASGLVESYPEPLRSGASSQLSITDSSYGSDIDYDLDPGEETVLTHTTQLPTPEPKPTGTSTQDRAPTSHKTPDFYASILATAALQLMSASTRINIPRLRNKQLQLRVALHSGPCSAGVVGLRTGASTLRLPHYRLFGPTLKYTNTLCTTGLALQIRVSKQCRELLVGNEAFKFERCPDYAMVSAQKPVESYWLVGRDGLDLKLPSLDNALNLTEYDDIEI